MSENSEIAKDPKAQAKAEKAYAKAMRPWFKKKRFWALGFIALTVISSALGGSKETSSSSSSTESANESVEAVVPAIKVTANKLISDLEENALAAKNSYNDKQVIVTGKIGSFDASGNYFSLTSDELSFTNVQIFIDDEFVAQVSTFKKGQVVSVTGRVTDVGELLGYQIEAESIS